MARASLTSGNQPSNWRRPPGAGSHWLSYWLPMASRTGPGATPPRTGRSGERLGSASHAGPQQGSGRAQVPSLQRWGDSGLPRAGRGTNSRCTSPLSLPTSAARNSLCELFLGTTAGKRRPHPPPLWRPTGAFLRPQSLPSGLPPHLQLVGTGPPPSAGLASSNNLATLLCINPPELEAQDAGRVDESLFLQSQREVRRRGSAPPHPQARPAQSIWAAQALAHLAGAPPISQLGPTPEPLRPASSNLLAQHGLSCLNSQPRGRLRVPGR